MGFDLLRKWHQNMVTPLYKYVAFHLIPNSQACPGSAPQLMYTRHSSSTALCWILHVRPRLAAVGPIQFIARCHRQLLRAHLLMNWDGWIRNEHVTTCRRMVRERPSLWCWEGETVRLPRLPCRYKDVHLSIFGNILLQGEQKLVFIS